MAATPPERLAALRELIGQAQPVVSAHERTLEVDPSLRPLLPLGALQRGTTVSVTGGPGATSLALALVAGPSRAGSWVGCVSVPSVGWLAAGELGVELERLAVVRAEGEDWGAAAATLVDGFDVVLCGPDHRPRRQEVARLAARARERGSVLVALEDGPGVSPWSGADVQLRVDPSRSGHWQGVGRGWGGLRSRSVAVMASGRHGVDRVRRIDLLLPGPDGGAAAPGVPVPAGGTDDTAAGAPGGRVLAFRPRSA